MTWQIIYEIATLTAAAISAGLIFYLWRSRDAAGAKALMGLLGAVAFWSLAYHFDFSTYQLAEKIWWTRIRYIGAAAVPPLWFVFARRYASPERPVNPLTLVVPALISLAIVVLVWTNSYHNLVWKNAWLEGEPPMVSYDRAVVFWLFVAFSYSLLFSGTIILIRTFLLTRQLIRRQLIALFIGLGAPWLSNLLYILKITPLPGLDLTPLAFTVTGLALSLGLFRFKLLAIAPVAREAVFEGLADPVVILDLLDRIVDFNSAAKELFRDAVSRPLGQPARNVFPNWPLPSNRTRNYDSLSGHIELGVGAARRHFEMSVSALTNSKTQVVGRLVFLKDVTERAAAAAELKRTQEMYELLAENTADLVSLCDSEANFVYVSPSYEAVLGYQISELVGRPIFSLVHPDDLEHILTVIAAGYEELPTHTVSAIFRMAHQDGRWLWFESVGRIIFDPDGQPNGAVFNTRDITDRKAAEEARAESENRLRLVADSLPVLIAFMDRDQRYRLVNKMYEKWFGQPAESIIGLKVPDVMGEGPYSRIKPYIEEALAGRSVSYQGDMPTVGGGVRKFFARNIPNRSEDGSLDGYFVMVEDITERLKSEEALKESEKKYRELVENIDQGLFRLDLSGQLTYLSPGVTKILGYDPEMLIGINFSEVIHPDDLERVTEEFGQALTNQGFPSEYRVRRASGDYRWIQSNSRAIFDGDQVVGIQGIFSDVTPRHESERALRESEERYRTVVEESFDGIMVHDGEFIIFANRRAHQMLGYEPGDLVGLSFRNTSSPESHDLLIQRAEARLRGEEVPSQYEVKSVRRDGTVFETEISARLVTMGGRKFIQTWFRDISDKKKADAALRESEEKFATAFRSNPGAITIFRQEDGVCVDVNQGFTTMYGWEREEAIGRTSLELGIWEDPDHNARRLRLLQSTGAVRNYEFRFRNKNGATGTALNSAEIIDLGGVNHILSISQNITDRKKAEEEALRLATAIEQAAEDIIITDLNGAMVYVNPAFERLTGYAKEEVLGENPRILKSGRHDPAFYQGLWETITAGRVWTSRITNRRKNGEFIELEATISPIFNSEQTITGFVSVKRDITEQKKLETQLRQSQKMEALGTLAGGIAHDFNNILTIILGYTQMAQKRAPNEEMRENLSRIMSGSLRAMELVKRILTFSRQTEQELRPVDMRDVIDEALQLLRPSLPSTIEIHKEIEAEWATVMADPTQLHQILLNLCTNAFQAMSRTGGRLEIGLQELDASETNSSLGPFLVEGSYLHLTVSDTGYGIPPDIKDRIFDPYFTTKAVGEGTGLGLAMVLGIVESYGGAIRVYSEVGHGTTFHVYLPTMSREETQIAEAEIEPEMPVAKEGETLLFVDDEEALADVGRDIMESLGYRVDVFTSSPEALKAFKAAPGKIQPDHH